MNQPQSNILLSLVQGDAGRGWASGRQGWKQMNDNACEWEGIECNQYNEVISILITQTAFSGTLPAVLGTLTSLRELRMGKNKMHGTIPPSIAALPNLVNVNLAENRITGTLHPFRSIKLRTLDLGSNDLHGSIPASFLAADSSFQYLSMTKNRLSSTIPESLSNLISIDTLNLSDNNLHGTIPRSLGKLALLKHLHLNNNFFVGQIPPTLATSHPINGKVGDLLEKIYLQDNQLSGKVPIQLADLSNLKELVIHENKLTGQVPNDICSETINSYFFQGNFPPLLERNYCDAIACPVDTVASDGSYPCIHCDNRHYNPYIGQTRECNIYTNQREILRKMYVSTTIHGKWDGQNNWGDDEVFLCDLSGVTCDSNFYVTEINLSNRGLKGTIPGELGFLQYLEKIDVSDNQLTGFLPSDLQWAPIQNLDISGNKIRGIIPPKLCLTGINGNGYNGDYNCGHIACPEGTYSPSGRKDLKQKHDCLPCPHNNPEVLGYKACRELGVASGVFGAIVAIVTLSVAITGFVVIRMKRKRNYFKHVHVANELEMQTPINRENWPQEGEIKPSAGAIQEFHSPARQSMRNNPHLYSSTDRYQPIARSEKNENNRSSLAHLKGESTDGVSNRLRTDLSVSASVKTSKSYNSHCSNESPSDVWLDVPKI